MLSRQGLTTHRVTPSLGMAWLVLYSRGVSGDGAGAARRFPLAPNLCPWPWLYLPRERVGVKGERMREKERKRERERKRDRERKRE